MTAPVKTISELIAASEGHIFVHRVLGRPDLRKYVVKYLEEYYVVLSGSAYLFSGNDGSLLIPYEDLTRVVTQFVNTGEVFEAETCKPQRYEEFDFQFVQDFIFGKSSLNLQVAMARFVDIDRRWSDIMKGIPSGSNIFTREYRQYIQSCLPDIVSELRDIMALVQRIKKEQ